MSLRELTGGQSPTQRHIARNISASVDDHPRALARRIRDELGISTDEQAAWVGAEDAFKHWRNAVESRGVFVFKRPFKQMGLDAFCLPDQEFPVIFINNKAWFTRQTFSLFHELAHILFSTGGITKDDDGYIALLDEGSRKIEIAANRVAHEVLVPEDDFALRRPSQVDDAAVKELADRYKVSWEVVLRRLLDSGMIGRLEYEARVQAFAGKDPTRRGSGGNYYNNEGVYFSRAYAQVAFSKCHAGDLSLAELADHLRIKARNIPELEAHLFGTCG